MSDPRFVVEHGDNPELNLVTRTSDGQLMFLVNKLAKMKRKSPLGSRIVEVHNGSSLFTGDAGQGESNIRQWIIENDWLEAIIALPLNLFYNTGIATYIWVLSNRKPEHRRGKVQLIDATARFRKLRRNLGKKNCEMSPEDIDHVCRLFLDFVETDESKIFPNDAFGYWKVTVERPLRLKVDLSPENRERFRKWCDKEKEASLAALVNRVAKTLGSGPHFNFNAFIDAAKSDAKENDIKLTAKRQNALQDQLAERHEAADPVVKKQTKLKADEKPTENAALFGQLLVEQGDKRFIVEYEPDSDLRDSEQIPFLEEGGIDAFLRREVLPHVGDAWIDAGKTQTGYEIPFTRHFYKYQPLRSLEEITTDIRKLEKETEGLLQDIAEAVV
jgi:type I restriction enzyme M protein